MPTNYTNTNPYLQTTKDTVPASTAGTGTITTATGTPTLIKMATGTTAQFRIGAFIYIAAQSEVRRVVDITETNAFVIDKAFTTPLAASAYAYIPAESRVKDLAISVTVAAALINGQSWPVGATYNPSKANLQLSNRTGFVEPVVLDATGGSTCLVSTLR